MAHIEATTKAHIEAIAKKHIRAAVSEEMEQTSGTWRGSPSSAQSVTSMGDADYHDAHSSSRSVMGPDEADFLDPIPYTVDKDGLRDSKRDLTFQEQNFQKRSFVQEVPLIHQERIRPVVLVQRDITAQSRND